MPRKLVPGRQMFTGYLTKAEQRRLARIVAGIVIETALNGYEFQTTLINDSRVTGWERLNQLDGDAIRAEARAIAKRLIGEAQP